MPRLKLWLTVTLVIVAAAALATFLSPGAGRSPSPRSDEQPEATRLDASTGDSPTWAGSASCVPCHEEEFELWLESDHARADRNIELAHRAAGDPLALPDPFVAGELGAGPLGSDRRAFDPPRDVTIGKSTWRLSLEDGAPKVVLDEEGHDTRVYRPDRIISYDPLWQLLIPTSGGRWQVTSLAYDPRQHDWFDVYGDDDRYTGEWGHWLGRGMTWNAMCASCHMTNLRKGYDIETDSYATTWVEPSVGCESCHGPYGEHVEWHETVKNPLLPWPGRPVSTSDTVFDTCGSCHARRGELTHGYVPGELFTDHYRPVLPDERGIYYPDGQVLEEDYVYVSFLGSRMHGEGVRCIACHDEHTGKLRYPGNEMCMSCHEEKIDPAVHGRHDLEQEGGECVGCHMPRTTYMQRDPRRDHGMTIPDPLLTRELGIPNACSRCHDDKTLDELIQTTEEWYGERMARWTRWRTRVIAEAQDGDEDAIRDLIEIVETDASPVWRASAALLLRPWVHLEPVRGKFLYWLGDPDPLLRSAAVRAFEFVPDGPARVGRLADDDSRLVRIDVAWTLRRTLDMKSTAGRDLAEHLDQVADQPSGALQRGVFYLDRGDVERAEQWMRKAAGWDPNAPLIRHSLAVVLARRGRQGEAVDQLREAVRLEPDSPDHAFSLALALAEAGRNPEARAEFERACKLDPTFARAWYNLGLLRVQEGDREGGIQAIERAEREDPDQPEFPYALATIHIGAGDLPAAREAAERALRTMPNYPPALELLDAIEQGRGR